MNIPPNVLKSLKPEELLQIQVRQWFELKYKQHAREFHHIANERRCSKLRGYILQLMGVKPGVADIFIDVQKGHYRGLWVELKVGKNKPSSHQILFLERKIEIGYSAVCVIGFEAATAFIEAYMSSKTV